MVVGLIINSCGKNSTSLGSWAAVEKEVIFIENFTAVFEFICCHMIHQKKQTLKIRVEEEANKQP